VKLSVVLSRNRRRGCNVPDLDSLGNAANVCVGSIIYSI
jgi:hypothetical protein